VDQVNRVDRVKIYLSDNAADDLAQPIRNGYASQLNPDLFGEWVSKSFWYGSKKDSLDIDAGLVKLDRLVERRNLHGKPIGFDVENEPPSDIADIAHAVADRFPYLRFGVYVKTNPKPPADSSEWQQLAPYVGMTWSQGWLNTKTVRDWEKRIKTQADRWAVYFPTHIRAIAMRCWPHPNVIRKGWWHSDLIPRTDWARMWEIADQYYDIAMVHPPKVSWNSADYWYQTMAEIDPRLCNILWRP